MDRFAAGAKCRASRGTGRCPGYTPPDVASALPEGVPPARVGPGSAVSHPVCACRSATTLVKEPMSPLSFSIVINTCDRRDSLLATLAGLEEQRHGRFEVVVVVGPSRDDTAAAVRARYGDRVVLRDCPQFNLSMSRNVGIAAAAGDVVAFIDDDAVPAPTWLSQLELAYLSQPGVAGFGGRTFNVNPGRGELQFLQGWITALADQVDVRRHPDAPLPVARHGVRWYPRFHGTNQTYRRDALLELGGFDERFEYLFDDSDIAVRMAKSGHELRHLPLATVYHAPATGRNRGAGRFDINWYCWLRSTLYFALQNGRADVGRLRALRRSVGHISWFWHLLADVERNRDLDSAGVVRARLQLRRATVEGLGTGLLGPRRIPVRIEAEARELVPFRVSGRSWPAATRDVARVIPA